MSAHVPSHEDFSKKTRALQAKDMFISDLIYKCAEHNVAFIASGETHVNGCNGYFDDEFKNLSPVITEDTKAVLACAMGKAEELWFPVLLHESCHMDQWIEQCPVWTEGYMGERDTSSILFDWVDGNIELDEIDLNNIVTSVLDVELDCEKRAAKKIETYGLDMDVKRYIQTANSYVMFHRFIQKHRKWYKPHQEPYNLPHIWKQFPDHWLDDYSELPEELEELYKSIT